MTSLTPPVPPAARVDRTFPKLTAEQLARIGTHGWTRPVQNGDVLASSGRQAESFFIVSEGTIELIRRSADTEEVVAVLTPGQFTGEISTLSGRHALVNLRVREAGEVIEVKRDDLLALVQND